MTNTCQKIKTSLYIRVCACVFLSHPYKALEPLVSGQQFLVQFDSFQVAAAELGVGLLHVLCTLAWELAETHTQRCFVSYRELKRTCLDLGPVTQIWTVTWSVAVTCSSSISPSWWMVKLRQDPGCRLLWRRCSSCARKWECILIRWSRQGNKEFMVLGSSWSSSSMPCRNTLSMIYRVLMWCSSVWISSDRNTHTHHNHITQCINYACSTLDFST